jgi:hypothetical protein
MTTLAAGLAAAQPAPLSPPGNTGALERIERMSPAERRAFLDRLPPERRARLEERLRRYEALSPEEKDRLRQQYRRFRTLPPERQETIRKAFERFRELPPERRRAVRRGVWQLRRLADPVRERRINGPGFRARFSPDELQLIRDMLGYQAQPEERTTAP